MRQIVSLSDFDAFMDGAIRERIHREMTKIAENVLDPNTEATQSRELTVKIVIKPTKNRKSAVIRSRVASKLAAYADMEADVAIGVNDDGEMVIVQQLDVLPGQLDVYGDEQAPPNVVSIPKT